MIELLNRTAPNLLQIVLDHFLLNLEIKEISGK